MNKILDFLKTNFIVAKWTAIYFFVLWAILWYLFRFDMFSQLHWWKFFHAHLRGFVGLVFGLIIYTAIPIYIATTAIIYRTKKPIFKIPFCDKISERIKSLFIKPEPEAKSEAEPETETTPESKYPENLPSEMHVPFARMKQRLSVSGTMSVFNKTPTNSEKTINEPQQSEDEAFPIPTDFDIGDSLPDTSVPTFTEINFDTPTTSQPEPKIENTVTKYFDEHGIEYETYENFVVTEKHIIYTHSDTDFWIIDNETWFAAGKQIDSPIPALLELSHDNGLKPIIYFESKNIMDFDGTVKQLTESGITVITDINELKD